MKFDKQQLENRIDLLTNNFDKYLIYFTKNIIFEGPSIFFHRKVINKIRKCNSYTLLLKNELFFEYIYATLTSWGLHRMGRGGPKLNTFIEIKKSIVMNKDKIFKLHNFKLLNISKEHFEKIKPIIVSVFNDLKIMRTNARLVGNSKMLHHLLPDLIPPFDRQYTLTFFFNDTNIYRKEEVIFWDLMEHFHNISRRLKPALSNYKLEGFNTSIPKIIDNAIIGFVLKELNR